MKFINKLFIVLAGVTTIILASCGDDNDYTPGATTNSEGLNVYFDPANNSSLALGPTDTEFKITISRNKADKAISVPLSISEVNTHLFVLPQQVEFASGELNKDITVKVSPDMEMFITYQLSIALDPSFTTPYAETEVYPRVELNIVKEDYKPYATGTYYSKFWGDEDDNFLETSVTMEYSKIQDNYRLKNCWGEGTGSVIFTWDGANVVKLVTTSIPVGLETGDGAVTAIETEDECFYNVDNKTFTFPLEWTVSAGSYGVYPDSFTIEAIL